MEKQVKHTKKVNFRGQFRNLMLVIIAIGALYGSNYIVQNITKYYNTKTYVEPYCAVKYAHSVEDYKSCKDLSTTELIKRLTEQLQKENTFETVNLPMIKM